MNSRIAANESSRARGSMPASSAPFQCSSTVLGRSKQTALLTVVLPPTHLPCRIWKLKSRDCCSAPSE
jgi:hypothetical protein